MKLILVRHGESTGNSENRLQGHADYELTDLGRLQAQLTAERLATLGVTALYTSPLSRAHDTAMTIAARLSLTPTVVADVSEYDFGEYSGLTYTELRQRYGAAAPTPGAPLSTDRSYPGEEGRENFFNRVMRSIGNVIESHPDETVAVVSHGGPIAVFCQNVLGLPYRRPMPFGISNASLTTIETSETSSEASAQRILVALNDTCHLKGTGRE